MILCRADGHWFLVTGVNNESRTCWLRCGANMPRPQHFLPLPPAGAMFYGSVHMDQVSTLFYPSLRYHGLPVLPIGWDPIASDPILSVIASPSTLQALSDPYFQSIIAETDAAFPSQVMLADGWSRPDRAVFEKRLHVDELEKFVGPLPEDIA